MMKNIESDTERGLLEGILGYLSTLIRYRLLIIIVTGSVAVGLTLFCVLSLLLPPDRSPLPNMYTAEATIVLQQNGGTDLASSILLALGVDQHVNTQSTGFELGALLLQILKSRSLLDRLIDEHDMMQRYRFTEKERGKTRELVLRRASFGYTRNTGTMVISFQDIDPVFASDVANKMVSLLDEWLNHNRGSAKLRQRELLREKIAEVSADITGLENRQKTLQKKYGVLNAQDLGATQAASIANLRSQLVLREIEIKNYASFSKIDDPRLEQLKEEKANIVDLIAQVNQGAAGSDSPLKTLPDIAQEFSQITLELEIQRRIYNTLSPQYEALKLTTETEPIFQVLDRAEAPGAKSGPQRLRIIFMGTLGAFAGGILLAFTLSLIDKVRKDPEKRKLLLARAA